MNAKRSSSRADGRAERHQRQADDRWLTRYGYGPEDRAAAFRVSAPSTPSPTSDMHYRPIAWAPALYCGPDDTFAKGFLSTGRTSKGEHLRWTTTPDDSAFVAFTTSVTAVSVRNSGECVVVTITADHWEVDTTGGKRDAPNTLIFELAPHNGMRFVNTLTFAMLDEPLPPRQSPPASEQFGMK